MGAFVFQLACSLFQLIVHLESKWYARVQFSERSPIQEVSSNLSNSINYCIVCMFDLNFCTRGSVGLFAGFFF